MEKQESESEWKADDSAPISSKGRKGADFINQTTTTNQNRFPWITIAVVVILLIIVSFFLLQ
ncbi:hypothetical protein RQM65_02280 [Pricia sp. S334]|uniref:Uncharacterized protein n=1 Tax=Pricia mediterranea TaxID=3076079 RepID=A0ABU3L1K4_9FLAO|nr:hypothetical protein [Pricia sp. S334]MDT7827490.1 hypothetical protein [Pricia sp. S334]